MKKILAILGVFILAMVSIAMPVMAASINNPVPVIGILQPAVSGLPVTITNIDTGIVGTTTTFKIDSLRSGFQIEWTNIEQAYNSKHGTNLRTNVGDTFKLETNGKFWTEIYNGVDVKFLNIVLEGIVIPVTPEPTPTPTPVPVDDCVCDTCQDVECPTQDFGMESLVTLLIALFALGGGGYMIYKNEKGKVVTKFAFDSNILPKGCGFYVYKNLKGKDTMLHKHPGILGKHNPTTKHIKIQYRHAPNEFPSEAI